MKHNLESSNSNISFQQKQELLQNYKNQFSQQQSIVHGIPTNKGNIQPPTMADLLSNQSEFEGTETWNFKQSQSTLKNTNSIYQQKIYRQNMQTETHDQYRNFQKDGNLLYPEPDFNTMQQVQSQTNFKKNPQPITFKEPFDSKTLYKDQIPEVTSIYDNQFSQCNIKDKHQLRKHIIENQKENYEFQGKRTQTHKYNASQFQGFDLFEIAKKNNHLQNTNQQQQQQQQQVQVQKQEQSPKNEINQDIQIQQDNNSQIQNQQEMLSQQESNQIYQMQSQQESLNNINIQQENDENNNNINNDIQNNYNIVQEQDQENQIIQINDEETETNKRRQQRIKKFNNETRDLPDSAFLTYFGKPPFANYGNKNVSNKLDGFLYGNYLHTHNVNPHRNVTQKETQYQQSNTQALNQCEQKDLNIIKPKVPLKFIEEQVPKKYPNYLKSEGQQKQNYKEIKEQKEKLKKMQKEKQQKQLEMQEKQKEILLQKKGENYLKNHLDLTRSENHIQKKITQQQQIDQEKFIQQQLEQRLDQLEFEQDPDQSFLDNLQQQVTSNKNIPFNIVVTKPQDEQNLESSLKNSNNMNTSLQQNIQKNNNNSVMMGSSGMSKSQKVRIMEQSKNQQQQSSNKKINESNLLGDRRQSNINKNKTQFKIDKSSMNQTRQLSFKLKVQKDPEDHLNKAQKVFSRFNQTKSTLDQDKKILQKCKQIKQKQTQQQIQIEENIKKFDPAKFHKYVSPQELNPSKYKKSSETWINRMPPAGKRQERNDYVYSVIQADL